MGPLVVVFLRGGADGLSLLVPVGDPSYAVARGPLAVAAALPVDSTFGLHPGLRQLHARWLRGQVAAVPAVAVPKMSRSHFDAQFRVESSASATGTTGTSGWLGRHLARTGGRTPRPFRGVSFGSATVPRLLAGTSDAVAAPSLPALSLGRGRLDERREAMFRKALGDMWDGPVPGAALTVLDQARSLRSTGGVVSSPLQDTVAVLNAGLGTEVAVVDLGGWDTHANQGANDGTFAGLVDTLDRTVEAALTGVKGATVLVVTEFGRRVLPNSSGGTDHGRGGTAFVVGPGVDGGVRGHWPGLASLDEGDVPAANDLRDVLAETTVAVLSGDDRVVGQRTGARLDLFR